MNLAGQRPMSPESIGAIPIPEEIHHVYGTDVETISKPAGSTVLVLAVESGTFRCKGGTHPALTSTGPSLTVDDGTGSFKFVAGTVWVMPAPSALTLIGTGATDTLTYYWY